MKTRIKVLCKKSCFRTVFYFCHDINFVFFYISFFLRILLQTIKNRVQEGSRHKNDLPKNYFLSRFQCNFVFAISHGLRKPACAVQAARQRRKVKMQSCAKSIIDSSFHGFFFNSLTFCTQEMAEIAWERNLFFWRTNFCNEVECETFLQLAKSRNDYATTVLLTEFTSNPTKKDT